MSFLAYHSLFVRQVLVEENLFLRTLILNRPQQLNALSFQMVCEMVKEMLYYDLVNPIFYCSMINY